MAIAVGADRAAREAREAEGFDLLQVAARPAGDEPGRPERLVSRTHHLAERGRHDRVVQGLEHHHGRPRQFGEGRHLLVQARVHVARTRRCGRCHPGFVAPDGKIIGEPLVLARLRAMGHHVYELIGIASAASIMRVRGGYEGMDYPRSHGGVAGF